MGTGKSLSLLVTLWLVGFVLAPLTPPASAVAPVIAWQGSGTIQSQLTAPSVWVLSPAGPLETLSVTGQFSFTGYSNGTFIGTATTTDTVNMAGSLTSVSGYGLVSCPATTGTWTSQWSFGWQTSDNHRSINISLNWVSSNPPPVNLPAPSVTYSCTSGGLAVPTVGSMIDYSYDLPSANLTLAVGAQVTETYAVTPLSGPTIGGGTATYTLTALTGPNVFDFNLTAALPGACGLPPTAFIQQGEAVGFNINVVLSSGSAQPVDLSDSQTGPGSIETVWTGQTTVTPNGASTLEVYATSSTPPGSYAVRVQGVGGPNDVSHSVTVTVNVAKAGPPLPASGVVSGTYVEVLHAGSKQWVPVSGTFEPRVGDTVRTGVMTAAVMKLGSDSITLNFASQVALTMWEQQTVTYLSTGEVYQSFSGTATVMSGRYCNGARWDRTITNSISGEPESPSTGAASSSDPTRFLLSTTNTTTSVQVYEGIVTLNDSSGHSVSVPAGSQSSVSQGAPPSAPTPIDDKTPPSVTSVYPNGPQQTVNGTSPISVVFSKPIDPSSAAGSNFTLADSAGNPVAGNWTIFFQRAAFKPATVIPAGTYDLTVKGGPHGVRDFLGDVLPSDYSIALTVPSTVGQESASANTTTRLLSTASTVGIQNQSSASKQATTFVSPLGTYLILGTTVTIIVLLAAVYAARRTGDAGEREVRSLLSGFAHRKSPRNLTLPAQTLCPTCGTPVSSGSVFCDKCGARLGHGIDCASCGFNNPEDVEYCTNCGKKL